VRVDDTVSLDAYLIVPAGTYFDRAEVNIDNKLPARANCELLLNVIFGPGKRIEASEWKKGNDSGAYQNATQGPERGIVEHNPRRGVMNATPRFGQRLKALKWVAAQTERSTPLHLM
jgi:hypothetical protein